MREGVGVGIRAVVGLLGEHVVAEVVCVAYRFAGRVTDLRKAVEVIVGVADGGAGLGAGLARPSFSDLT